MVLFFSHPEIHVATPETTGATGLSFQVKRKLLKAARNLGPGSGTCQSGIDVLGWIRENPGYLGLIV
jgi:hypothetical protein